MARTLLLVDRNPTIRRLVELSFAGEGVDVVSAGDADEAIGALSRATPDVVLADVGVAGSGGYEVAAHIRRTPSLSRIPIVLLAGAFEEIDRGRATAAGADDVFTKPIDPPALVTRVRELWSASGEAPQPPVAVPAAIVEQPAPAPVPPPVVASPEVDRYFEQLDRAFADLAQNPRPVPDPITWPDTSPLPEAIVEAPPTVLPGSPAWPESPVPQQDVVTPEAIVAPGGLALPQPVEPSPVVPPPVVPPPALTQTPAPASAAPGLTEAFAALLYAEQSGTPPPFVTPAAGPPAPPIDVDRLADLVASRVLERLTSSVVREAVADLVSDTAERLVREEIERIKRNIT